MNYKKSVILHTFMGIVFLLSGLTLNLFQGIIYLLFYNTNKWLYRKLNYYLIYSSWSQIVAMTEWWSNTRCNVYGDEKSLRMFGKEHSMVVMNHKYDIDWLICWFVCDKFGMLGNAKTCAKRSLQYIPVIGWGWIFAEMIFLERSWEKDRLVLGSKLDNLLSYEDPIMLLVFSEGTRFTPEKHKASMEFAKERNLPILKHHLLPRTRGFNFCAAHLKSRTDAMYTIQLAFPDGVKPSFYDLLCGKSFVADLHINRIPINEIPTDNEEETSAWLYKLYQSKDKLVDDYLETGKFPGECMQLQRTPCSLMNAFGWAVAVGLPFLYAVFTLLTCGILWVQALTVTGIVLGFTAINMMIGVTKASKGSSYGKTSPEKNGVNSNASAKDSSAAAQPSPETNGVHLNASINGVPSSTDGVTKRSTGITESASGEQNNSQGMADNL